MCPISRAYCLPHLSASRDLQTSGCAGNAVLALNALDVNPKVELVHSRYDRLRQFRECPHVLRMQNTYLFAFAVAVAQNVRSSLWNRFSVRQKIRNYIPNRLNI